MAILYFVSALIVILINIKMLPQAIVDMFRMAFSVQAVGGGVAGSVVAGMMQAMRKGVARGCFSNEAGMGSAAITPYHTSWSPRPDPASRGWSFRVQNLLL